MIESIMYFGIGFLVASLLGLIVVPLVHNRAVRLTMRRLEAATPLSMAEIQAEKDQLRAEFAMSTRRLEMSVDQLKARSTSQLGELAKKSEAVNRLKIELGEKTATIFAIEAREKTLRDQIRATEQEYEIKNQAVHDTARKLADKEAELGKVCSELDERSMQSDAQRVEIVALRAQSEALKEQLNRLEREFKDTEDRLFAEKKEADAVNRELAGERGRVENLGGRIGELDRALFAQKTEADIFGRRVQELEARLNEQGRLLVEREYDLAQVRSDLESVRKTEADLRAELAATEIRRNSATETLRMEKARLEGELTQMREDRVRLQREISGMKREAESSWASERVENALLRERINDIAAEVARLTAALEGPGSPIEAILAGDAKPARAGPARAEPYLNGAVGGGETREKPEGDLAERIRALQTKASRVTTAG